MQYNTIRTDVGEALFQLKYRHAWDQVDPLAEALAISAFPLFSNIGLIVPVPASKVRNRQPVYEIATALAKKTRLASFENIVQKVPAAAAAGTPQLKNLNTKEDKVAALAARFTINDEIESEGKWNVLVVDDLFDSGTSMEIVCATLKSYHKIDKIYVAALTWK